MIQGVPEEIAKLIADKPYTADSIGMSGSGVYVFEDCVLKAESFTPAAAETVEVMRWLDGRLPVPRVIAHRVSGGKSWLLMSRVCGEMSCGKYWLEHTDELTALMAEALRLLWSIDISACPRDRGLDKELAEARSRVERGLCDGHDLGSFKDAHELLGWLEANRPEKYEPVLSHGDLCLPNVFVRSGRISGFIDLGDCGIGDRWRDIALCWRSLKQNLDGTFGGEPHPDYDPDLLFEKLGIRPDREKLRYYLLLDELF